MARAFSKAERMERIRLAMDVYNRTGRWADAEPIAHRQNVLAWCRDPEVAEYARSVGFEIDWDEKPTIDLGAKIRAAHVTARKSLFVLIPEMREGAYIARDGARTHYGIKDGMLCAYKLDGLGKRNFIGSATFSGADVMATDWVIVE